MLAKVISVASARNNKRNKKSSCLFASPSRSPAPHAVLRGFGRVPATSPTENFSHVTHHSNGATIGYLPRFRCDMRCCRRVPGCDSGPGSGCWTSSGRRYWRSRPSTARSGTCRSGDPILQRFEEQAAERWTTNDSLGTERWLGRHFLRPGGPSLSVLADARIHVREGKRRPLRRRLHLCRQVVGRLRRTELPAFALSSNGNDVSIGTSVRVPMLPVNA